MISVKVMKITLRWFCQGNTWSNVIGVAGNNAKFMNSRRRRLGGESASSLTTGDFALFLFSKCLKKSFHVFLVRVFLVKAMLHKGFSPDPLIS